MMVGLNLDTVLSALPCALALAVIIFLLRKNWKQYGVLLAINAVTGVALCYLFVQLSFYSFPFRLLPELARFPIITLVTVFPAYSAAAVCFSPRSWAWKLPFYWVLVHLVTLTEALVESNTQIIKYNENWTIWESYVLWWLFLLAFEWLGGKIVKPQFRRPMDPNYLRYGRAGWYILHAVLVLTILLAGMKLAS